VLDRDGVRSGYQIIKFRTSLQRDLGPVWRDFLLIKRIRRFARHSDDASFLTEHIARAFSRR
jgi:hypothetical protein